ncbi:MAG: ABC transporter permease/substrate-binding protein [Phycisphaeraceae bacterium]
MSDNLREQLANLPVYLGQHILLTVVALGAGIAISLPLAVSVTRWQPGRWPLLTAVGVIQTVPGLALLALAVAVLIAVRPWTEVSAFGFLPAVTALTLYSMLPIVRNTVTGILEVDPAITEAARGLGMTPTQRLWRVELPLALPVIIAGVRTAAVWVVGTATLSTPVGQPSLGNYLFGGLQTQNWTMVVVGCIAAAGLAIALDALIALLEKAASARSVWRGSAAGLGLVMLLGGGLAAPTLAATWFDAPDAPGLAADRTPAERLDADTRGRVVRIGSKPFTEQYILSALIGRRLQEAGFEVERRENLGSSLGFQALGAGEIDVLVEYAGTVWTNYMNREAIPPAWHVLNAMEGWLADEHGIRSVGTLGFENAYALAMRRELARELGIASIADLADHAPAMSVGGDYEIFDRPEWRSVRQRYGLRFAREVVYDSTFMYRAVRNDEVQVITAYTTDARLDVYDLTLLADPLEALPPYDAILLLSSDAGSRPDVVAAIEPLVGAIDMQMMREASHMVDREQDKRTVTEAAAWLAAQIEARLSR